MKKLIKILAILAVIGIIGGVAGYVFVYNKPHPDYESVKAEYVIEAKKLYDEFRNDPSGTGNRYNGKILEISGMITSNESTDSTSTIVFVFNQGDFGDEGVRISMLPGSGDQAKKLTQGTVVTLKGLCTGYNDTDVILEKGTIIKPKS